MRNIKIIPVCLALMFLWPITTSLASTPKADLKKQVAQAAPGLQLPFVENKGQVADSKVAYVTDTFACRVSVTTDGQIVYGLLGDKKSKTPGVEIKEHLVGDSVKIQVSGRKKHGAMVSYYPSRDKSTWRSNVQTYEQVSIGRVASGIKMVLSARGKNVEKLFFVEPGANPTNIRLSVEGAEKLSVKTNGQLELATASGAMRFSKPIAYQEIDGKQRMVKVGYQVSKNKNTYGFNLGKYDSSKPLVIDPLITVFPISQSGFHNILIAVTKDADGNIFTAGASADQLVVFKLDSRLENVLASVRFNSDDEIDWNLMIRAMTLDSQGNVIVAGNTMNENFPVTEGCHDSHIWDGSVMSYEGFVTKFSADLSAMLASTFIGGDFWDEIQALVVDEQDQIYVGGCSRFCGSSGEQEFPITSGAFDEAPLSKYHKHGVVAKIDNDLSTVIAATYLGGHDCDIESGCETMITCLTIDSDGNLWAAGHTDYNDFPTTDGCIDPTYNGDGDIFVSKMDPDLTQLLVSTQIGGPQEEAPTDMHFDTQGNIYLLGWTYSNDFPMPSGGYMPEHSNYEEDGFILKLPSSLNTVLAGTFLGGPYDGEGYGDDVPAAMAFSADGSKLQVVGRTESRSFPITADCYTDILDNGGLRLNSLECSWDPPRDYWDANGGDGFLATFSADLTQLHYSTFLGGCDCDYLDDVLVNGGDIIIVGEAKSTDFPMIESDDPANWSRGAVLRFSDTEARPTAPDDPDNPDSTDNSGDGGGGGCFISSSAFSLSVGFLAQ